MKKRLKNIIIQTELLSEEKVNKLCIFIVKKYFANDEEIFIKLFE